MFLTPENVVRFRLAVIIWVSLASCVRSTTDHHAELALLGISYVHYMYSGSSSGLHAFTYNGTTGQIALASTLASATFQKGCSRHPYLPVIYCLGTSGNDVLTVIEINRDAMRVVQTLPLLDASYGTFILHSGGGYGVLSHGANNDVYTAAVHPLTGLVTILGTPGAGTGGAAMGFSANGAYFYARLSGTTVHEYSFSNGVLTATQPSFSPGTNTWIFVPSRDGRYMYSTTGAVNAFRFNTEAGPASNFNSSAQTLTMSVAGHVFSKETTTADGSRVYYVNSAGRVGTLQYDSTNGNLTETAFLTGVLAPSGFTLSPDENFFITPTSTSQHEIYQISSTGSLARISGSPFTNGIPGLNSAIFFPFLR